MSPVKLLFFLLLAGIASAQIIVVGPMNQPPVDPSLCQVDKNGQTSICFAKDGVHVSIAGQPYGGALCDSSNPSCKGPAGVNGSTPVFNIGEVNTVVNQPASVWVTGDPLNLSLNFNIPQGPQGSPGVIVGNVLNGTLKCAKGQGTVQAGFTDLCTFTITGIQ